MLALFMPHCNFGSEEVVGKLGKAIGKPFLLWGPRDQAPPSGKLLDKLIPSVVYLQVTELYRGMECHLRI